MSLLLNDLMLWAQAGAAEAAAGAGAAAAAAAAAPMPAPVPAPVPGWLQPLAPTVQWLFVFGEPTVSIAGWVGSILTWLKVIGLFSLLAWVASRVVAGLKERSIARGGPLDIAALVALVGLLATALVRVLQSTGRLPEVPLGPLDLPTVLALVFGGVLFVWIEKALWTTLGRVGIPSDRPVLVGIHLALLLGILVGFALRTFGGSIGGMASARLALFTGVRLGATYMGFVVLAQVFALVAGELFALRGRRLYSIARLSVIESTRRMWAPWVVIAVFLVVLAFTHWFLQPPRPAEMGRLFVGTLTLLCSLLLTVMVTILAPISLPNDIRAQTIYTIVSKPVRRLELVWGRMLGFMAIVTGLILVFGVFSLVYLWRNVGGTIQATEAAAVKAAQENRLTEARQLREQADQLRSRMAARVPVKGVLTFLDSRGTPQYRGIDVGQELEKRTHIEGATPATAIWTYGVVPDPLDKNLLLDRRIPVGQFLPSGTIEELENRIAELRARAAGGGTGADGKAAAAAANTNQEVDRLVREAEALRKQSADLEARAAAAEAANPAEAQRLREEAARLHAPPVPLEMTFNVYRTTKGRIGEPVYAELEVTNPRTGQEFRNILPIREYYTNKQSVPAGVLVGSLGNLVVEVRCISPTQYLGMAESDLYLLARSGNFGTNFMLGLFGVWLQAMVLTAIGVFAGTFLSWPVALLTTVAFFIAGNVAFGFLQEFALQTLQGGGPFESLIRLLSHDNLVNELTPTLAVVTAKTLDSLVMPVMSRLVFIVPNFSALDVSNTVAEGYAVLWPQILGNVLLALAYALPFSIAGYFILKNREVAA